MWSSCVQRPILLKGHSRPLTMCKYNREGDLLFTCAKDNKPNVSRHTTAAEALVQECMLHGGGRASQCAHPRLAFLLSRSSSAGLVGRER
jgi:hypothetical protein